jgi:RNA polymerase sigma-32 factor
MNQRMAGGDHSLNTPVSAEGLDNGGEWLDWLEDERPDQESSFADTEELSKRQNLMVDAMQKLNPREVRIIEARRLSEPPLTLEALADEFSVSRERIRQIEVRAFEKLSKAVLETADALKLLPQQEQH